MKNSIKLLLVILLFALALSVVSCGASKAPGGYYGDSGFVGVSPDGVLSPEGDTSTEPDVNEEDKQTQLPAGMITAGAWNDNENYEMWVNLFMQGDTELNRNNGKFLSYTSNNKNWGFNSLNRVKVNVACDGKAVAGAEVVANGDDGAVLFKAISDAQGNAYLFTNAESGSITVTSGEGSATAEFSAEKRELTLELEASAEKLNVIELMFVVDVTGSMGDELSFLKAELGDIINKIAANDEQTQIKLAFLFYRDNGDSVPFKFCDFLEITDASGLDKALATLKSQSASGGGDYEEAVDEALEMAVNAQWSTGATTKLIFHVLDAPAHSGSKYETRFNQAVVKAAEQGIRISPILCSGAAEITEYTMRQAAIYTGGTFIFVTDDSGIGGEHHDPGLPNATVELLNSMLVRLIKGYHTGVFDEPIYWQDDPALAQK